MEASNEPSSARDEHGSRWQQDVLRHPLFVALIGFVLTGLLGSYLSARFSDQSHFRDIQLSTRNVALVAISDVSDLTAERRERANLVASAINRGAPSSETDARKLAYDEAYLRWNSRVPGDLLRVRSALQLAYRPQYEGYIDLLTNVDAMAARDDRDGSIRRPQTSHHPGLFSKMDGCLTTAYDTYRSSGYENSPGAAQAILKGCKFKELYGQSVACFSMIAELLYRSVSAFQATEVGESGKRALQLACTPPNQ